MSGPSRVGSPSPAARQTRDRSSAPAGRLSPTLRVEIDRHRPTARRLLAGLLEMSYVDLADPLHLEFEYMRRVADVMASAWPPGVPLTAVHLGGAACTLARYLAAVRPRSRSDVYESSEEIVALARASLGLRTSRSLRVRVGDARELLARREGASADLVIGDAFQGTDVPPSLLTVEFVQDVARVLNSTGVYVLNVIDAPPLRIARTAAATLLYVFDDVALSARPKLLGGKASGNLVLIAATRPLPVSTLAQRANRDPLPERLLDRAALEDFAATASPLTDSALR